MTLKLHPLILIAILIGVVALIFSLFKGCQKSKDDQNAIVSLKTERLILKDSINSLKYDIFQTKLDWQESMKTSDGILSLKDNKIVAISLQFDIANNKVKDLLKNRISVTPSDTGTTIVPNEFIEGCQGCYIELESQNLLINKYRKDVKDRDSFANSIVIKYNQRISQLDFQNQQLIGVAEKSDKIAEEALKKAEPHRRFLFSLSTISFNDAVPDGIGVGGIYSDKKGRLFNINAFGTNKGSVFMAGISMPLSFKRK